MKLKLPEILKVVDRSVSGDLKGGQVEITGKGIMKILVGHLGRGWGTKLERGV